MNNKSLLSNLDKLLVELVFQLEQDSHSKEHVTEQIQLYTANALEVKQQIHGLQENINKSDHDIFCLQKYSKYSKDNCSTWKPTYMVFNNHEAYLESQLQSYQEATERDKKIYEEHINQYQKILWQHQAVYAKSVLAKEYYMKKAELDDIQNRILLCGEQLKWKEAALMDLQEPAPFLSCNDWALQIASLRKNTEDTVKNATLLMNKSSNLTKEACELELKKKCPEQQFGNPNLTEITGESKNLGKEKEFKESIFEDKRYLLNKEHQINPLHVPSIPQKLVRPLQSFKLSMKKKETDGQDKENDMNQLTVRSIPLSQIETVKNNTQKYNDFTVNTRTDCGQSSSVASLQNQMQFRLHLPQGQTKGKKGFQFSATETGNNSDNLKATNETRDSAYASQDILKKSLTPEEETGRLEENSDIFSRTPECLPFPRSPEQSFFPITSVSSMFVRSSESTVNKEQLSKTPTSELANNVGCEGQTSKSPAFSFLMTSTPKSPHFNLFESSVFETTNSSDQQNDSYSDGNVNPASPHKEIGCLFGKLEKDEFTFTFHPEPSPHTFGNGKDEFSFPFSFGKDQRSSQTSSFNGFQSSSQSAMQFTFF
ncbi:protein SIX6OS1 [Microcaecilia unicolor]|uniref:Protein SIX6OS1 n=1 Tax=Microcaecilia unicolor TaxID=1415580 RepID=A0A6P7Z285_9AMPH|nr:protein SIX6OS1 [Microcaecilia unicolor]